MSSVAEAIRPKEIAPSPGNPPTLEQLREWEDFIWENGYIVIPGVLSADEVAMYLEKGKTLPPMEGYHRNTRARIFEHDYRFVQLLEKEPVVSLMRAVLGEDMHVITQMMHITERGTEVLRWHIDENYVPYPEKYLEGKVFPPMMNGIHCHYYLVDVPIERGPTTVIPGSHESGRKPNENDGQPPKWKGKGPLPLTVKAGDCVMYSNMLWHSGSPNLSGQTRYSIVNFYGRRFVSQRLYPFVNYKVPEEIFEQCTESQKRLLGAHPMGRIYG